MEEPRRPLVDLRRMLEDQSAFNRMIFNKNGADARSLMARLRELGLGMVEETLEFLRTFDYKVHRRSKLRLQNMAHSHEEMVDQFKYWLSLADLVDFPLEKLEEMYYAKSRVVQYRYQDEWVKKIEGPCVLVDIDQVLADYITGMADWAHDWAASLLQLSPAESVRLGNRLEEIVQKRSWLNHEAVGLTHLQWQQVKHDFRTRGGKRTLPVFKDAKPFLQWCQGKGWAVILVTSRPVNEYPNIFTDTLTWLHDNSLPFDHVWWANEKGERIDEEAHVLLRSQIMFAVDDSEKFVAQFRSKGIKTYHLDRGLSYNDADPTHDPYHVRSLHDLIARQDRHGVVKAIS
jgi:FMN phosphatase YigB (HAD superfamily)